MIHEDRWWKENVMQMEDNEFDLLKALIAIIASPLSESSLETVSVALFDIGEFARLYPNGRSIVKTLGGKEAVMHLLDPSDLRTSDENDELAEHALTCVSKLMIQNWQFLT